MISAPSTIADTSKMTSEVMSRMLFPLSFKEALNYQIVSTSCMDTMKQNTS